MTKKKIEPGWLFLGIIVFHMVLEMLILYTDFVEVIPWNMATNLILSEAVIWVPCVLYLAIKKVNPLTHCRIKRVKVGTVFMTVLFTMLCGPIVTLSNAISMLFVDNTVVNFSGSILEMPFLPMLLLMAVYGPFVEEIGFRGMLFTGYKSDGNVFRAVLLSAFLFAIMHMNFNQAAYAFVIGVMLALLMEATDSIWPVFIVHFLVNAFSVCTMFLMNAVSEGYMELVAETANETTSPEQMLLAICVYFVLAVMFTPLAICVLVWIANHEGRIDSLKSVWASRKVKGENPFDVPLILGIIICFVQMFRNL